MPDVQIKACHPGKKSLLFRNMDVLMFFSHRENHLSHLIQLTIKINLIRNLIHKIFTNFTIKKKQKNYETENTGNYAARAFHLFMPKNKFLYDGRFSHGKKNGCSLPHLHF